MKMEILLTGGSVFVPERLNAHFSTVVYLEHESRKILIDPGNLPSIDELEKRFSEIGVSPEEITDVFFTHLHLDHIFNSIFFENATFYVHESYATKNYRSFGPLLGRLYSQVISSWKRIVPLKGSEVLMDGKMKVFHTPWHAREHLSFLLYTENMGRVLVTGDVIPNRLSYYDIIKGYEEGHAKRFLSDVGDVDLLVFPHDAPLKPEVKR
ncbi:MBL fold metallo-hydrolase [Thermotoga neapolitana]|uniref:Metallo-beta-lactamase domain-containing protein 1 n=1 Tax=Thermotoga neapolitana (strain ATCC 49049 / DSM 4359 / NBRC 107923 / NS-E) TaxID=309803 RepID=B9KA75_THENN|nr:MBL fold metallo-hydrolase [Thermotoga neapolitana]ACM23858.1 Beta-lactamase domain protein [Thermotoga neapolitana DSM 4359]KFZ21051.1 Beta-lactamase domain protein [Thermotoga neapolitana LA10]HBF10728.1 MBL fold metallo-hydrolase [Thermotoga neapolitana]